MFALPADLGSLPVEVNRLDNQSAFPLLPVRQGRQEARLLNEKDGETWRPRRNSVKEKDRDAYLELVQAFPLASIKSDEYLEAAQVVMDQLLAKGEFDDGEEMYLDA